MKKLVWMLCAMAPFAASAQEIGTEIPPEQAQQEPSQPTTYDNPYAQPPPPPPQQPATPEAQVAPSAQDAVPGPRKGAFGLRAGFGGSGVPGLPATGSAAGATTPTIGFKFLATDSVAIRFDVGVGLGIGNRLAFGFGTGFGIQAYLGSSEKPVRPFFLGEATLGKTLDATGRGWSLGVNVGGGAEYFFSDYFSLEGQALLGVPISLDNPSTFVFATFQPGLGANFYF